MKDFEKIIKINDNRIIRYITRNDNIPLHIIREDFLNNGSVEKNYKMYRSDDYNFDGWINIDYEQLKNKKNISFDFDKDHILYIPLLHLLNGDDELIIEDDMIYDYNKKYLRIYKENELIKISFNNELNDDSQIEKFNIFVKNICFDGRSKLDWPPSDIKERLFFFYKEVFYLFKEEYHQVTTEEYLLNKSLLTNDEIKKYVKKLHY